MQVHEHNEDLIFSTDAYVDYLVLPAVGLSVCVVVVCIIRISTWLPVGRAVVASIHLMALTTHSCIKKCIATDYGVNALGSIPGSASFFLFYTVQTGSGPYPVSYPVDTGDSFPGGNATGA
jgi:hypothetical protein